jgi:hypothetical protein
MRLQRTDARLNTVQWDVPLAAVKRGQKSSEECCRIACWNSRSIDAAKAARGKDDYEKSMVNYFKRRPLGHDMGGSGRGLDWTCRRLRL